MKRVSAAFLLLLACSTSADIVAAGTQAPTQPSADHCALPPGAQPRLPATLLPGMGDSTRFAVTTTSAQARAFFQQGLSQIHSFWFNESERSCLQALEYDPDMAMAHWCIALSAAGDYRPAFQLMRNTATSGTGRGTGSAPADEAVQRTTNGAAVNPQI